MRRVHREERRAQRDLMHGNIVGAVMHHQRAENIAHRRSHKEERHAIRDLAHGNFVGAAIHHARAENLAHHHHHHHHPHHLGPGIAPAVVGAAFVGGAAVAVARGPPVRRPRNNPDWLGCSAENRVVASLAWQPPPQVVTQYAAYPPAPGYAAQGYAAPSPLVPVMAVQAPRPPVMAMGGHAVASRPSDVLLEGWLSKQAVSAVVFKNWKRRLIWLRPDSIEWRRSGPAEPPAGTLRLTPRTIVAACERPTHSVSVTTDDRTLVLQCASEAELRLWFDRMTSAVAATNSAAGMVSSMVGAPAVASAVAIPQAVPHTGAVPPTAVVPQATAVATAVAVAPDGAAACAAPPTACASVPSAASTRSLYPSAL
jgi:hypothetical protein